MRSPFFFSLTLTLLSATAFAWLYDSTPVNCLQSEWSEWMKVGYNERWHERFILRHPSNGGRVCGPNEETEELPADETVTAEDTARAFDTFFLNRRAGNQRSPDKMRDLLVILDESGSIGTDVFEEAKAALAKVLGYICPGIGRYSPKHQVAFMTFSSRYTPHFDFNTYGNYEDVRDAILQVPYSSGGTATHNALDYARVTMFANGDFSASTKGLRSGSLKEVLLITDGHPSNDISTISAAARLRDIGVTVFALGIGNIDQNHMEQLVSDPSYRHIFHLNEFGDFDTMVDNVEAAHLAGEPCINFNPWATGR